MDSDSVALACYRQIAVLSPNHPVYVVQHEASGKLYVEKVLSRYHAGVFRQLMEKPIAGIPHIYEVVEHESRLYVIEDYVPGDTLQEKLDENGCLTEDMTLDIILQLCRIVNSLHRCAPPIIHRDIKPSNIILTPEGLVRLLDMNAARVFSNDKGADTFLMGTAGYAAPEQYGFAESSFQTDIYSIGVLMNVLLTGKLPTEEMASGPLRPIIQRCIMLEPSKRYPSVQTLIYALNAVRGTGDAKAEQSWRRYLPPGFRSGGLAQMILAAAGYAFLVMLGTSVEVNGASEGRVVRTYRFIVTLMLFAMVLFSGNYLDIHQRLPLTRSDKPIVRIIGIVIGNVLCFVAAVVMLAFFLPAPAQAG